MTNIDIALKSEYMSFDMAWVYCLTLTYKGHKDWRMPTYEEWQSYNRIVGWHQSAYKPELYQPPIMVCPVRTVND